MLDLGNPCRVNLSKKWYKCHNPLPRQYFTDEIRAAPGRNSKQIHKHHAKFILYECNVNIFFLIFLMNY
jgi:predicted nucleic-acid-binding Zn-ribbon protein